MLKSNMVSLLYNFVLVLNIENSLGLLQLHPGDVLFVCDISRGPNEATGIYGLNEATGITGIYDSKQSDVLAAFNVNLCVTFPVFLLCMLTVSSDDKVLFDPNTKQKIIDLHAMCIGEKCYGYSNCLGRLYMHVPSKRRRPCIFHWVYSRTRNLGITSKRSVEVSK